MRGVFQSRIGRVAARLEHIEADLGRHHAADLVGAGGIAEEAGQGGLDRLPYRLPAVLRHAVQDQFLDRHV